MSAIHKINDIAEEIFEESFHKLSEIDQKFVIQVFLDNRGRYMPHTDKLINLN